MSNETKRPTLLQLINFLFLYLLGSLLALLPHRAARTISGSLGVIAFDVLRINRRLVLSWLEQVFPEKTPAQRRRIGRAGHGNLVVIGMETIRARLLSRQRVLSLVKLEEESEALIHKVMEEGKGAIFVSGHYGNWELLGACLAAVGYPFLEITQDLPNPLFNRFLTNTRERLGISTVNRREAVRGVFKALRDGSAVGILADQDAGPEGGILTDFFGKTASTFKGPFAFAVRCDAPLVAAWICRGEKGRYRVSCERIDEQALADLPADAGEDTRIRHLAETFVHWLEERIRQDPRQYFWQHPRWQSGS